MLPLRRCDSTVEIKLKVLQLKVSPWSRITVRLIEEPVVGR